MRQTGPAIAHQPAGPADAMHAWAPRLPALCACACACERDGPTMVMAACQSLFQEEAISGSTYGAGHSGGDGECWGFRGHCHAGWWLPAAASAPCGRGHPSHAARSAGPAWWCYAPACLPAPIQGLRLARVSAAGETPASGRPASARWPNFTAPLHHPSGPARLCRCAGAGPNSDHKAHRTSGLRASTQHYRTQRVHNALKPRCAWTSYK